MFFCELKFRPLLQNACSTFRGQINLPKQGKLSNTRVRVGTRDGVAIAAENRFPRFWAVSQEQKWPGQRSNTMLKWNDSLNLVVPSTYAHVYEIQREFSSARS